MITKDDYLVQLQMPFVHWESLRKVCEESHNRRKFLARHGKLPSQKFASEISPTQSGIRTKRSGDVSSSKQESVNPSRRSIWSDALLPKRVKATAPALVGRLSDRCLHYLCHSPSAKSLLFRQNTSSSWILDSSFLDRCRTLVNAKHHPSPSTPK